MNLRDFDLQKEGEFQKMIVAVQEMTGWTDDEMAEIAVVSRPTIQRWKSGKYAPHPLARATLCTCFIQASRKARDSE